MLLFNVIGFVPMSNNMSLNHNVCAVGNAAGFVPMSNNMSLNPQITIDTNFNIDFGE